jgi:hypothetical protein
MSSSDPDGVDYGAAFLSWFVSALINLGITILIFICCMEWYVPRIVRREFLAYQQTGAFRSRSGSGGRSEDESRPKNRQNNLYAMAREKREAGDTGAPYFPAPLQFNQAPIPQQQQGGEEGDVLVLMDRSSSMSSSSRSRTGSKNARRLRERGERSSSRAKENECPMVNEMQAPAT